MKLNAGFYQRDDVTGISRELLGKRLCTRIDDVFTAGIIVETEAYSGAVDRACHAYNNRRTKRTEVIYQPGGVAYVYLCYGIHYLFNIVTNVGEVADAILIRAIEPVDGIGKMLERRKMNKVEKRLTAGPGALSQALGITRDLYGADLTGDRVWIESTGGADGFEIETSRRIGVDYAGEDALLPWRFTIKNNQWVSK